MLHNSCDDLLRARSLSQRQAGKRNQKKDLTGVLNSNLKTEWENGFGGRFRASVSPSEKWSWTKMTLCNSQVLIFCESMIHPPPTLSSCSLMTF